MNLLFYIFVVYVEIFQATVFDDEKDNMFTYGPDHLLHTSSTLLQQVFGHREDKLLACDPDHLFHTRLTLLQQVERDGLAEGAYAKVKSAPALGHPAEVESGGLAEGASTKVKSAQALRHPVEVQASRTVVFGSPLSTLLTWRSLEVSGSFRTSTAAGTIVLILIFVVLVLGVMTLLIFMYFHSPLKKSGGGGGDGALAQEHDSMISSPEKVKLFVGPFDNRSRSFSSNELNSTARFPPKEVSQASLHTEQSVRVDPDIKTAHSIYSAGTSSSYLGALRQMKAESLWRSSQHGAEWSDNEIACKNIVLVPFPHNKENETMPRVNAILHINSRLTKMTIVPDFFSDLASITVDIACIKAVYSAEREHSFFRTIHPHDVVRCVLIHYEDEARMEKTICILLESPEMCYSFKHALEELWRESQS